MDTLASHHAPEGCFVCGCGKTVVTRSAGGCAAGAVALLSYKYNDRKIGQVYLISASAAEAGSKRGDGFRMTEIRHRIRQHQYRCVRKIEADEIFVPPDPAETSGKYR